ncbi:MAG: 3-hydroxyacyl-CoA dehydrogenase [Actinobacteria bacterium]|nr:3-hydroxyacyl-CoA dehydrogenase [Actinomycetota bacterium]
MTRGPSPAVAIVGGGSIGVAWAIVFARAGRPVSLFEPDAARREALAGDLRDRLARLAGAGLLDEEPDAVAGRVAVHDALTSAVADAPTVVECAPESLELKQRVFAELEACAPSEATLASSSSALTASAIAGALRSRHRCLVAHPGNPPYLLPVVEIVPAPFTDPEVACRASDLMSAVGMTPVLLRREVEGFVFNRLQGALLREAYCLVRDGVVTAEDVDRVVRDGPGRRWGIIGPFETAALNTSGGIEAHAERMGPAYERMGAERGQHDPWTPDLVATVAADLDRRLPLAGWDDHVARRDAALLVLERARRASGLFPPGRSAAEPPAPPT